MRAVFFAIVFGLAFWAVAFVYQGSIDGADASWRSFIDLFSDRFLSISRGQPLTVHVAGGVGATIGWLFGIITKEKRRRIEEEVKQKLPSPLSDMKAFTATAERSAICKILDALTLGVCRFYTVPQGNELVVVAFEKYRTSMKPGLGSILSFWGLYQQPWGLVPTKEIIEQFKEELVFTSDGVKCHLDVMICYRITNPGKAVFEVDDYQEGLRQIVQAVLRNECGKLPARSLLASREEMADTLQTTLEKDAEPWGIAVRLVEITQVDMTISTKQ